jgi:hypothetical protein
LSKKNIFVCVAIILALAMASAAGADTQKFKNFSLDVPDGWTATEDKANDTVTIDADDGSAAIAITYSDAEGAKAEDVAAEMSKQLGGSAPKADENGYQTFTFEADDGKKGNVMVAVDEDKDDGLIITLIGAHPEMSDIIGSMKES